MAGASRLAVLVPPGTYSVGLTAAGRTSSESIVIRKDPNTAGTDADIRAQTKTILEVRDNMNTTADLVNRSEAVRAQLAQIKNFLGSDEAAKELAAAADDVEKRLVAVEAKLFNITATGRGQDFLRMPSQLLEKLAHLADTLQLADFAPTEQQLEVHKLLGDQVSAAAKELDAVVKGDVNTFNEMVRRRNLGTVIVR
jgi:hypothetical protein